MDSNPVPWLFKCLIARLLERRGYIKFCKLSNLTQTGKISFNAVKMVATLNLDLKVISIFIVEANGI